MRSERWRGPGGISPELARRDSGEPLDAPELLRVRGAAVLAGELPADYPGHLQHCLGQPVLLGLLNGRFAGMPGCLGDRVRNGS
jgi:hypothetical protein